MVPRPVPTAPPLQPALTVLLVPVSRVAPTLPAVLPPLALLASLEVQETPPLLVLLVLLPVLLPAFHLPPPVLLSQLLQLYSLLTECFS